jgi:hypothetical protein
MSPATGGGDMGGEARSKRAGRRGHGGAHRGRGERIVREREDGAAAAVRSASADTRPGKERRGAMECSACAHGGGRVVKEKRGAVATERPL